MGGQERGCTIHKVNESSIYGELTATSHLLDHHPFGSRQASGPAWGVYFMGMVLLPSGL